MNIALSLSLSLSLSLCVCVCVCDQCSRNKKTSPEIQNTAWYSNKHVLLLSVTDNVAFT